MNTRQLFKQRVVELIHDLPYKEAVEKELKAKWLYWGIKGIGDIRPITLSRVMLVLNNIPQEKRGASPMTNIYFSVTEFGVLEIKEISINDFGDECLHHYEKIQWKLLTDDKQTATDDDQTDECIEELYNLIK